MKTSPVFEVLSTDVHGSALVSFWRGPSGYVYSPGTKLCTDLIMFRRCTVAVERMSVRRLLDYGVGAAIADGLAGRSSVVGPAVQPVVRPSCVRVERLGVQSLALKGIKLSKRDWFKILLY